MTPKMVGTISRYVYLCNLPSLESFSMRLAGFATLMCLSTVPKAVLIDLVWWSFDASNCPCKAVRSGSRCYEPSMQYVTFRCCSSLPWELSVSLVYCVARSPIYLLRIIIFLLMIQQVFCWRSIFCRVQIPGFVKLCLFRILRRLLSVRTWLVLAELDELILLIFRVFEQLQCLP
jgi:hypothetical protein